MKRQYDILHAVIMISFLVIAYFVESAIIKGVLLLLFSAVLIFNTAMKLYSKRKAKVSDKLFYGVLLLLDALLSIGALYNIVTAAI